MRLEILILLKDEAGKVLAVGPLADRFREMMATFLGPAMASLDLAFTYLTEMPVPEPVLELATADAPLPAAPEVEPATEETTHSPTDDGGASVAGVPIADGADIAPPRAAEPEAPPANHPLGVCRVNVPGSPLHNLRVRVREKWEVQGPEQYGCDILDGPDAGGGTSVYKSQLIPE